MTLLIAGLGLLGGSLALKIRQTTDWAITALGRNEARLRTALETGLVDRVSTKPEEIVPEADLIVIGTPVGIIPAVAESIAPYIHEGAVVTDIGSTKTWICRNMERILKPYNGFFAGSHPMAGSEKTGFENSRADLFENAVVVITGTSRTSPEALESVRGLWRKTGARIHEMTPEHHDRLVARTSHLPHAVAFAMAYGLSRTPDAEENFYGVYGGGLLDTLRIAASDPTMWKDIMKSNRLHIADAMEEYRGYLTELENWIRQGHFEEVENLIQVAGILRKNSENP